jgi:MFS family permease
MLSVIGCFGAAYTEWTSRSAILAEMAETATGAQCLERTTVMFDMVRSLPSGLVEAASSSLFLLIAVDALKANSTQKSVIAGSVSAGLLLSPSVATWAARRSTAVTKLAAMIIAAGAVAMCVALVTSSPLTFTIGALGGFASTSVIVPLITTVYLSNYREGRRGRYLSTAYSVRVASALVAGFVVGRLLDHDLSRWRWVVAGVVVAQLLMAVVLWRIPSQPLPPAPIDSTAGQRRWALLTTDRLVRSTLIAWMLMGFANLMMLPLRVEYLASDRYGIDLRPSQITLLTIVIPSLVRLLSAPLFGWSFDRLPFFVVRVLVNVGFAASIAIFFAGTSWFGLVLGSMLLGLASSAGDIVWNLWATKFDSTPQRTADVMSLHTFLTGIRGVIAPFAAFFLITRVEPLVLAVICAVLIVLASVILIPELRAELVRRRTQHESDVLGAIGP